MQGRVSSACRTWRCLSWRTSARGRDSATPPWGRGWTIAFCCLWWWSNLLPYCNVFELWCKDTIFSSYHQTFLGLFLQNLATLTFVQWLLTLPFFRHGKHGLSRIIFCAVASAVQQVKSNSNAAPLWPQWCNTNSLGAHWSHTGAALEEHWSHYCSTFSPRKRPKRYSVTALQWFSHTTKYP